MPDHGMRGCSRRALWTMLAGAGGGALAIASALGGGLAAPLPLSLAVHGPVLAAIVLLTLLIHRAQARGQAVAAALELERRHVAELAARAAALECHLGDCRRDLEQTRATLRDTLATADADGRVKGEFLAMMSHEIRTPMNGILGTVGLLLDETIPPPVRDGLEIVQQSGETLLAILNDAIGFSTLNDGTATYEHCPFNLGRVLRGAIAVLMPAAQDKGLALRLEIDPDLPEWIEGDPGRLRQILFHLIGNAIKFTETGSVAVAARPRPSPDFPPTLEIGIADSGPGIDRERAASLFTAFSHPRPAHGLGLGLATCRRLVEGQGGTIGLDSQPGRGSRFWFRLPLTPTPAPAAPVPPPTALSILLAEDNPVNRKVTTAYLVRAGHRVASAENGARAVAMAATGAYDLILMDVVMPELDGLEATRRIRALPDRAGRVPIVAVSANARASERERCLSAGMDAFVAKPIDPLLLFSTLDAVATRILAPPSRPAPSILDETAIARLSEHFGPAQTEDLLRQFLTAGQETCHRLIRDMDDGAATARLAHDLKSMAAYAGCAALADLAAEIEQTALRGDTQSCRGQGQRLGALWNQSGDALARMLPGLPPALTRAALL